MVLYDSAGAIGGQFNLARRIPGKEEFAETLRYFSRQIEVTGVDLRLGTTATADELADAGYDHVVLATGVVPRHPEIDGIDHPSVIGYADLILGHRPAGRRVAIVGAGGIGFDVAELLCHAEPPGETPLHRFAAAWGIDLLKYDWCSASGVYTKEEHAPKKKIASTSSTAACSASSKA